MEELTKGLILDAGLGFYERGPLLIKKYDQYRLSLSQTKEKTSWGWNKNEFKVQKMKTHGDHECVGSIRYMHELKDILTKYGQ